MSPTAATILRLVTAAEERGDVGAYSDVGVVVDGIVCCTSLSHRLELSAKEVCAAIRELVDAGKITTGTVRLHAHVTDGRLLGIDPDEPETAIRSEMVRLLRAGPQPVAALVGPARSGHRKRALNDLYAWGMAAPASALWRAP